MLCSAQLVMMWNVQYWIIYKREEYKLICNTLTNCMKVRMDQWEWEKMG
jgi:hypothetical protein